MREARPRCSARASAACRARPGCPRPIPEARARARPRCRRSGRPQRRLPRSPRCPRRRTGPSVGARDRYERGGTLLCVRPSESTWVVVDRQIPRRHLGKQTMSWAHLIQPAVLSVRPCRSDGLAAHLFLPSASAGGSGPGGLPDGRRAGLRSAGYADLLVDLLWDWSSPRLVPLPCLSGVWTSEVRLERITSKVGQRHARGGRTSGRSLTQFGGHTNCQLRALPTH